MTPPMGRAPGPAYEATLAFFGELVAHCVTDVVISPGSRSTPLAVAARHLDLRTWVQLDERSAGFFALGLSRASRRPVAVVCTSGTAAANHLPAVVEASHSGVPLLVCTADRPPELRGWGAGQTIDQVHRFGHDVRWFADLPVGADMSPAFAVRVAARALAAATGPRPGPVQLNWPFREPLEPLGPLPPRAGPPQQAVALHGGGPAPGQVDLLVELAERYERGLLVPGPCDLSATEAGAVADLAARTGWPILADPGSQLRRGDHVEKSPVVAAADHLAKVRPFTDSHTPDVVVRFGLSPTSKALRLWLERTPPDRLVLVGPGVEWNDATFGVTDVVDAAPAALFEAAAPRVSDRAASPWLAGWMAADRAAREAVRGTTGPGGPMGDRLELGGAGVVEVIAERLGAGASLYVSNSMPVRELDMFMPASNEGLRVFVNRGANGIDGLVSSALGVAAAGDGPVVLLTGDVALLHDAGSLLAAARLGVDLVIVVIDNAGGGIFSYLPIAAAGDAVGFEELFLTPHGTDLVGLGRQAGMDSVSVSGRQALADAMARAVATPGSSLIHVPVDHAADLELHRLVTDAVAAALATVRSAS